MKKWLTFLMAWMVFPHFSSSQQILNYGHSPDWTITDVYGQEHHLYELLDAGYTVLLDQSATWCSPCWGVHNAGWLDSLHTWYGPGSADPRVYVIMLEVDPSTNLADLQGTGTNTLGDWLTGTHYPVVDDDQLTQIYGVAGFPFVLQICPNRMTSSLATPVPLLNMTTAFALESINACAPYTAVSGTDLALLQPNPYIDCGSPYVGVTARMQNVGTATATAATVEAWVLTPQFEDSLLGSVEWTGDLATYEETDVNVLDWLPGPEYQEQLVSVSYRITSVDERTENNNSSQFAMSSQHVAPSPTVGFTITTDDDPEQIWWELHDDQGEVLEYQYGGYPQPWTSYQVTWALQEGRCYTLYIVAGQDGLILPGNYMITSAGTNVVFAPGMNDNIDIVHFRVDAETALAEEMKKPSLRIWPVPSDDILHVEVPKAWVGRVDLDITDALGRSVVHSPADCALAVIHVGALPTGWYQVTCRCAEGIVSAPLLVQH